MSLFGGLWSIATNGFGLGEGGLCGNKSLPDFAKPVLAVGFITNYQLKNKV